MTQQSNPPDLPAVKPAKCHECGCATSDSKLFIKVPKSFSHKHRLLCPTCNQRAHLKSNRRTMWLYLLEAIAAVVFLSFETTRPFGWLGLNLFLFFLCDLSTILLHEWAHVMVARLLDWKVFRVQIGTGKTIVEKRISGIPWQINAAPFGGVTFLAPPNDVGLRWKFVLINAAAVPIHIVLILLAFAAGASWTGWLPPASTYGPQAPSFLLVVNVGYLLLNLIGQSGIAAGYMVKTDGHKILQGLFKFQPLREPLLAARFLLEGVELQREKKFNESCRVLTEGSQRFPKSLEISGYLGIALLESNRIAEAGEVFRSLLKNLDLNEFGRAMMLNNIAWTNLMSADPTLLPEADELSAEAISKAEWNPSIRGTRGSILIEMGRVDVGLPLVSAAMDLSDTPRGKAANACYLAIGYARKGNLSEAQRYRDMAAALDSDCMLLPRADAALNDQKTTFQNL